MVANYDLHIHTTFSDGAHSVEEQTRFGAVSDLDVMAISDHYFPGKGIAASEDAFESYLRAIDNAAAEVAVPVLKAVEGTILNVSGDVSVPPGIAKRLDIVLVDFSGYTEGILRDAPPDREALIGNVIECMLNVCRNPIVDIVAHPFNLGRASIPLRPADLPSDGIERVAEAFHDHGKIFEIMNCMFWWFPNMPVGEFHREYLEIVQVFLDRGVRFSVGSDDHRTGVGNLAWSRRVIRELAIPEDQIFDPLGIV